MGKMRGNYATTIRPIRLTCSPLLPANLGTISSVSQDGKYGCNHMALATLCVSDLGFPIFRWLYWPTQTPASTARSLLIVSVMGRLFTLPRVLVISIVTVVSFYLRPFLFGGGNANYIHRSGERIKDVL
jgi:hypothetical protein